MRVLPFQLPAGNWGFTQNFGPSAPVGSGAGPGRAPSPAGACHTGQPPPPSPLLLLLFPARHVQCRGKKSSANFCLMDRMGPDLRFKLRSEFLPSSPIRIVQMSRYETARYWSHEGPKWQNEASRNFPMDRKLKLLSQLHNGAVRHAAVAGYSPVKPNILEHSFRKNFQGNFHTKRESVRIHVKRTNFFTSHFAAYKLGQLLSNFEAQNLSMCNNWVCWNVTTIL